MLKRIKKNPLENKTSRNYNVTDGNINIVFKLISDYFPNIQNILINQNL